MEKNELEKLGYKLEKKGDSLYYGGNLDLSGTGITSLSKNITVGGNLDLSGTGITSLPENITVGNLYLHGTGITDVSNVNRNPVIPELNFFSWKNRKYIKVDGIFSETISNKGNVYRVRYIGKSEITYLVTDGHGKWSHGKTLKEAKYDLIYKISNRNKDAYKSLTLESELTFENCIEMYRIITGACSAGTRNYIENRLPKKKKTYFVREIIELTKNEYGGKTFADFFKN